MLFFIRYKLYKKFSVLFYRKILENLTFRKIIIKK